MSEPSSIGGILMFSNFLLVLFMCILYSCTSDNKMATTEDFVQHVCHETGVDFLVESLPLTSELGGIDHWVAVFSHRFIPCDVSRPIHVVEIVYHIDVEELYRYLPDNFSPEGLPRADKIMHLKEFSLNLQRRAENRLSYETKVVMDEDSGGATVTMSSGSQSQFGQMIGFTLDKETVINLDVIGHDPSSAKVMGSYHVHFFADKLVAVDPRDRRSLTYAVIHNRDTQVNLFPHHCRE